MDDKIMQLKKWIDESDNVVFFGGAGVSTESGIPDFRSVDGPVSYTHLDVYKRQGRIEAGRVKLGVRQAVSGCFAHRGSYRGTRRERGGAYKGRAYTNTEHQRV